MRIDFVGANIKGTPAMPASSVSHDLRVLRRVADVFVVQEFRWKWYWLAISSALVGWASYPSRAVGIAAPNNGAQAIFWKRRLFKKLKSYCEPAFNFNLDNAGIMENRFVRGVLLNFRKDGFIAWYLSTHFVVGGDEHTDSIRRRNFMKQNIAALDKALTYMQNSGYPIMGEIDANIHKYSEAYSDFMSMMRRHGATFHGELGVEYAFTINGRYGTWEHIRPDTISTSQLKTDHESRVLHATGKVRERNAS